MPRSPSKDLADRFTGNRGYFHIPDGLRRTKTWLALAVLGLTVGWAVFDLGTPSRAAYTHTHGPLANPHATWDATCDACHRPQSAGSFSLTSVFHARDRWHDLTCETCHRGPAHQKSLTPEGNDFHARCSNCHHDHGGRTHSLVRLTDDHCTKCHADLHRYRLPESRARAVSPTITNFATDHPEFGELRQYGTNPYPRRTLKFNHALHMTPGLVAAEGGRDGLTAARVEALSDKASAGRYRKAGQKDNDPIQLACASCHQLDSGRDGPLFHPLYQAIAGEPRAAVLPPRAEGAYYLPVNFEAHCKACHPVRTPEAVSGKAIVISGFPVPHRKQPKELKELLAGEYARKLLEKGHPAPALPLPPAGRLDPRDDPAAATFRGETDRLSDTALSSLTGSACAKCHALTNGGAGREVVPVSNKTVWFTGAKFDHTAHRAVGCAECHPGTGAAFVPPGIVEPIRIAGVESCKQCHAPARVEIRDGTRVTAGGVRHACTDCHRYHDGEHPLQGRAAPGRDPEKPLSFPEFFRGKKE